MQTSSTAAQVSVPGFVDHHAHLLRDAAGVEPRKRGSRSEISTSAWPSRDAARWMCSIHRESLPGRTSATGS